MSERRRPASGSVLGVDISFSPIGRKLNDAANEGARLVLNRLSIAPARHRQLISDFAINETVPSRFLGVMLEDSVAFAVKQGNRSDQYFQRLCDNGTLLRLVQSLFENALSGVSSGVAFENRSEADVRVREPRKRSKARWTAGSVALSNRLSALAAWQTAARTHRKRHQS